MHHTKKFLLILPFLLLGCGPDVEHKKYGEPFKRDQEVSCNYTGYCYGCGMGFDGTLKCGHSLSHSCDGTQPGTVEITPVQVFYTDGTSVHREESRVIERHGTCN